MMMNVLEKILEEIENINYYPEGMGCGIEDCGITDRYEACEYGWNKAIEAVVESIQNMNDATATNDGWIPVEDGLPEEGEEVEVTIEEMADSAGGMRYYTKTAWVQEERWVIKRNPCNPRVIAWQPLPEPYKPENRNNNTTKEYQQEVEHLLEEIKSENGYVRVSDLAKRFEKIDHELFKDSSWNLLQILSNINILVPEHFD